MAPPFVCFTSSMPALSARKHSSLRSNATVCTLQGRSNVKSDVEPGKEPKFGSGSPSYTVLPPDLPENKRPAPPPVHWSIPLFGFVVENWLDIPRTKNRNYGGIYKSSFMIQPMHIVTDMSATRDILKDTDTFSSASPFGTFDVLFGSDSMILLDGPDHAALRQTIAPAFAPTLFPFYFDFIRPRVEKTWAKVKQDVMITGSAKLDPVFRDHYLSIAVEITTGIDMDSEQASFISKNFLMMMESIYSPRVGPIWNRGIEARAKVVKILEDLVKKNLVEKQNTIEKLREYGDNLSYKGSKDIAKGDVNVLLIAIARSNLKTGDQHKNGNDPEVISSLTNMMLLLWFAGYLTSAATSSCASLEMGMDSSIWARLVEEQDRLVEEAGTNAVTYEQVKTKMPLLDSFITEILRMYPAADGILRKATSDVEILGKYVKQGETIFLDFQSAMRDPSVYPDPDSIKVDRFVKTPGAIQPTKVLSFGGPGSPHYCIGAALAMTLMKTTFSVLLRKYELELDPNQSRKYASIPEIAPRSKVVVQAFKKRS